MQFIYKGTKFRQSGTVMQKVKPPSEVARLAAVYKVHPGFPAKPFTSDADIEVYSSGDTVCCLMCGQHFAGLSHHVRFVHEMSAKEYRARFNIPAKCSLSGKAKRERARARGLDLENSERLRRIGKEMKTTGYRPACPIARAKTLEAARKAHRERPLLHGGDGRFIPRTNGV